MKGDYFAHKVSRELVIYSRRSAVDVPKSLFHIFDFKFTPYTNFLVTNNGGKNLIFLLNLNRFGNEDSFKFQIRNPNSQT